MKRVIALIISLVFLYNQVSDLFTLLKYQFIYFITGQWDSINFTSEITEHLVSTFGIIAICVMFYISLRKDRHNT